MKQKKHKRVLFPLYKHDVLIEEFHITEREFGEVLTEKWDSVCADARLQKKALMGAKRIKELRLLLKSRGILHNTIQ